MTLILTDVSPAGIAMAADTALTERWDDQTRVVHGVAKLFRHEPSRSGLATWGESVLPNPIPDHYPVSIGFALSKFLSLATSLSQPDQLCDHLADYLNNTFPKARAWTGIDVASVLPVPTGWVPVVLRVTNSSSADSAIGLFRVIVLREPGAYNLENDAAMIVSGDVNGDVWIDELTAAIRHAASRTFKTVPAADLGARRQYLAVLARTVSDIYATMGIGRTIGGPVLTLGISSSDASISRVEPSEHGGMIIGGFDQPS